MKRAVALSGINYSLLVNRDRSDELVVGDSYDCREGFLYAMSEWVCSSTNYSYTSGFVFSIWDRDDILERFDSIEEFENMVVKILDVTAALVAFVLTPPKLLEKVTFRPGEYRNPPTCDSPYLKNSVTMEYYGIPPEVYYLHPYVASALCGYARAAIKMVELGEERVNAFLEYCNSEEVVEMLRTKDQSKLLPVYERCIKRLMKEYHDYGPFSDKYDPMYDCYFRGILKLRGLLMGLRLTATEKGDSWGQDRDEMTFLFESFVDEGCNGLDEKEYDDYY